MIMHYDRMAWEGEVQKYTLYVSYNTLELFYRTRPIINVKYSDEIMTMNDLILYLIRSKT